MDAIECTKDEESKQFQIHNIDFDFGVLLRIKESMVDLSSNCIEMALRYDDGFFSSMHSYLYDLYYPFLLGLFLTF